MNADLFVVLSGIAGFIIFMIVQLVIFRLFHAEAVFPAIIASFAVSTVLQLIVTSCALFAHHAVGSSLAAQIFALVFSYAIFGLMSFVYILCVFGPSETSIRIRVVRELAESPHGTLSIHDLARKYNGQMVLERRLERLSQSGEVQIIGGKYRLLKDKNVFFFIDKIAALIQGFITCP